MTARSPGGAPAVGLFYEQVSPSDSPIVAQERLAWVVVVLPTVVLEHGYWILVAPSARQWRRCRSELQAALLELVWDLTQELGFEMPELAAHRGTPAYAAPLWVWVLMEPGGSAHLMAPCQRTRKVAWRRLPSLNPAREPGSREALLWLFPDEGTSALAALDEVLAGQDPGDPGSGLFTE